MKLKTRIGLLVVILPLIFGVFIVPESSYSLTQNDSGSRTIDLSNGDVIEIAPDEVLREYLLSDIPTSKSGNGDSLLADESGIRVDTFTDERMKYYSAGSTLTTANLSVPLGDDWESYQIYTNITSITENRTWLDNSGFDDATNWTYDYYDEPSPYGSYINDFISEWRQDIGPTGIDDNASYYRIDGYSYHDPTYGQNSWYEEGDKAYTVQNLVIDRGEVTSVGISLDYWGDVAKQNTVFGPFELFVSVGDPDNGGTYLWHETYDAIITEATWYSTGYIEIPTPSITLPNMSIWVGLRVTIDSFKKQDLLPEGQLDNIVIYVTAKATPDDINLKMNGIDVSNVLDAGTPIFGLGTAWFVPITPWNQGYAYANFSWMPTPFPPDPYHDVILSIDADVWVFARKLLQPTIEDTELLTLGDSYLLSNATDINWETNYLVGIPNGYDDQFFFNITIPFNRDVTFISEPTHRYTNLTSWWNLGEPGDGVVNVSVYEVITGETDGFWMVRSTSLNMISTLDVWDNDLSIWAPTRTFIADDNTRFRASLDTSYIGDNVTFTIYDSLGATWHTFSAVVDSNGYAITDFIMLDSFNASVGDWEVQAFVVDSISGGVIHNVGYFRRAFSIDHGTQMTVQYPIEGRLIWSVNVTFGEIVFLQLRVNDSDNGDLLPGGVMTYSGNYSGTANDLGTGEYSITLDTGTLSSNGPAQIYLSWTKDNYDLILQTFTIYVTYEANLYSSDSPGVAVPSDYVANFHLFYEDTLAAPIVGASISCNWTNSFSVVETSPGEYLLSLNTTGFALGLYPVEITVTSNFYQARIIILTVNIRELHTSAIPSTSFLSLPVGYNTTFEITYLDTDTNTPITNSADAINCNWSDIHQSGDMNYTVTETTSPGIYEVVIYSMDSDQLTSYDVVFNVNKYGAQNHTFIVTIELRTHLTSLYLNNSIESVAYTDNITVNIVYYDVDVGSGIVNGTTLGGYVELIISSPTLSSPSFTVVSISSDGLYTIHIPANQWGDTGTIELDITMNWIGVNYKFSNLSLSSQVVTIAAATDIYIGENPVIVSYGENVTFSIIYYDVGGESGVVNGTGPYSGNVHLFIEVLTSGETITQYDMVITEIDFTNRPGEYRITFDTSLLNGLGDVELLIYLNWTSGELPYYENQVILITISTNYRLTSVDWTPLPITPYDELTNLSFVFRDLLTGEPIYNSSQLAITVPGYSFNIYYDGDGTGIFFIEIDTSVFTPSSHSFLINVEWMGNPFYQNRTDVVIQLNIRERYTDLTHGSYEPVEFSNFIVLNFTFSDLDDLSGITTGTLTLDGWLTGSYIVNNIGNGIYTLYLNTTVFQSLGVYLINVTIEYSGTRYCSDASDSFYLSLVSRRTHVVSDLPELTPYLLLSNITIHYIDDSNDAGITGATVTITCPEANQTLQLDVNYWVVDGLDGSYVISIDTIALGDFGSYTITVTVSWLSGSPYYQSRVLDIDIEVSRRSATITVSKSPLNTAFLENVTFEVKVIDNYDLAGIDITKSNLILHHGGGTLILDSQYTLSGSSGTYTISIDSEVLTSDTVEAYLISIEFVWGDYLPYYSNSSTTTEVTIEGRFTQLTVLQTPPGYYYFNMSALFSFTDYLTGSPVIGATLVVTCLEVPGFIHWEFDNGDGTYITIMNTTSFPGLGRYNFTASIMWFGSPYYSNITNVAFSLVINPVSTSLTFVLPEGSNYYVGDIVYANITYTALEFDTGIPDALITTDWEILFGTNFTITPLAPGIYQIAINTSTLDAQLYRFTINASKYLHQIQSIYADILLAATPIQIELIFSPISPDWGDIIEFQANVTDAQTGQPIIGAFVNLTIADTWIQMISVADGLYNCTVDSSSLSSGDHTVTIKSILANYEIRIRDFYIRINKIPAKISASLSPLTAVNGQAIRIEVDYLIYASSLPIEDVGFIIYSWVGGSGQINWSILDGKYVTEFIIFGASVGTHQILIQASSSNYKSVLTLLTIEITEVVAQLVPISESLITLNFRDIANITVYLNNTDLSSPIIGASLSYGVGPLVGNLTETNVPGYYYALVNTSWLSVQDWTVTISSVIAGYTPSSIQFTLSVDQIETEVVIPIIGTLSTYYGKNITFYFFFNDTNSNEGIIGAITNFTLEHIRSSLVDHMNGSYSLTIDTSLLTAGSIPHDISVTFRKENYHYAFSLVKLLVIPIPTEIRGNQVAEFPVYDNYTMLFGFWDELNDEWITDGTATAVWEFGTVQLVNLHNGSYLFGPDSANLTTALQERTTAYRIRISISRTNYSRIEMEVFLTIREIDTDVLHTELPTLIQVGEIFYIDVTYLDLDHSVVISDFVITIITDSTIDAGIIRETDYDIDHGNGTYTLAFSAPNLAYYSLRIEFSKEDYQLAYVEFDIYSELSPEQEAMIVAFEYGAVGILLLAGFAALYTRILSVPKLLRILRGMVKSLSKGKIPSPASVLLRREMLLAMMVEDLKSVGVEKTLDDISPSTVDVIVMDVEDLLQELAKVIGLAAADIGVLRQDLSQMRPSERAGFISEVLKQERARRAKELAEAEMDVEKDLEEADVLSEDEILDLRERLLKMGIEETEVDLMIEQAKHLTRAEIEALLEEIGGA